MRCAPRSALGFRTSAAKPKARYCATQQPRFRRYNTKWPVLFKMRLEHKKARHRQLSVFIRQLQEFKHVMSLRQIALKDLRQIILKATTLRLATSVLGLAREAVIRPLGLPGGGLISWEARVYIN